MADLFRVTVVAEADGPVSDAQVDGLVERLTSAPPGEGAAQLAEDAVTVRSDRRGCDVVLLLEAESADDARALGERTALAAVQDADLGGVLHIELVRAEPAFAP